MSDYAYNVAGAYTMKFDHVGGHACNCIGCCRKCGQCRTAPWHPGTCDAITELRRAERVIVSDENVRLRKLRPAEHEQGHR